MRTAFLALAGALALLALSAAILSWRSTAVPHADGSTVSSPEPTATAGPALRRGDLAALQDSGELRVLVREHSGTPVINAAEQNLIEQYARSHGLRPVWIGVPESELQLRLNDGRGDLAVGARRPAHGGGRVAFTLPWGVAGQRVATRAGTGDIRHESDLLTRQVAVRRNSPVRGRLESLAGSAATMELVDIPEELQPQMVLSHVESGRYDVAVMDGMVLESLLSRYPDVQASYDLVEGEARSWAVRADAPELLRSLNRFLNRNHLEMELARVYREDLDGLQERKTLRLITYQGPAHYYFEGGRLKGFEYELIRRFAERYRMRVDVVIARSHEEMRSMLLGGRGDLVAASLPARAFAGEPRMTFTRPYNYAAPVVVGRELDTALVDARDLDGRRVVLPAESPYRHVLRDLQRRGIDVDVVDADPALNTEETLFRVANGMYDLAVIGSHQVRAEFARQMSLAAHFTVSEPAPLVWAVRRDSTQLQAALNDFIDAEFRKGYYNVLYAKYLEHPNPPRGDARLLADVDELSPYDEIVHEYAAHYDFDWRLIVAQMFQESQFDPTALSYAGAEGLMQLLPTTADQLGVTNVTDPATSISGGVRYLDYLRGRFEDNLLLEERTWFTLAAYNAGFNRVQRARRLAEEMNLDASRWFDNVEVAMLALSRPYWKDGEVHRQCRCGQTVVYVRDIRTRYNNYVRLTGTVRTADAEQLPGTRI